MKAEKGDLIRITNVPEDWAYPVGGIYEVTDVAPAGTGGHLKDVVTFTAPDMPDDTDSYYAYDEHYEIFRKAGEEDEVDVVYESYIRTYDEPKSITNDADVTQDAVNHPNHYTKGRVEVIDVIEDAVDGADPFEAVCQANVLKYMLRYRHKNGVEDVKKAVWYANKLIEHLEAK